MKHIAKKVLSTASLLALCASTVSGVFAASAADIHVNGQPLADIQSYQADGFTMVPIRPIADALDIEVNWNAEASRVELVKLPLYVTFAEGIDAYTFAKMAPQPLGRAPEITDGKTYVPLECVSEILQATVAQAEDGIHITFGDEAEPAKEQGDAIIKAIEEEELLVTDAVIGDVRLALYEGLEIKDTDGNPVAVSDLTVGTMLKVEYAEQMGYSMPPFNAPKSITVVTPAADEVQQAVGYAEVSEVTDEFIMVEDTVRGTVMLIPSEETKLADQNGKAIDTLKQGDYIMIEYSPAMTASLPPQNTPVAITIVDALPEQLITLKGSIAAIEEDNDLLLRADEANYPEYLLIIGKDTKFINEAGQPIATEDITVGQRVKATVSPAMTRSLPPQTAASTIQVITAN